MPWFPLRGVVKKLRLERHWTREQLADKSGVKVRTIRLWESENPPRTGSPSTVKALAGAFKVPNEEIAYWRDYDPDLTDELGAAAGDIPQKSTLGVRAARDDIREWIAHASGERLEVLGPRLLRRIQTAPGLYDKVRYAISGKVREHRGMPSIVGTVLKLDPATCGQFLLVRKLHTDDLFYTSPFTTVGDQTGKLIDAADSRQLVTVVVRVEIRIPGKIPEKEFKGFIFFQKKGEKPSMHKWCFVVDEVLTGDLPVTYGEAPAAQANQSAPH